MTDNGRKKDLFMLACLNECAVREEGEAGTSEALAMGESTAFMNMHAWLLENDGLALTKPQRRWVERVCARLEINTTPIDERPPVPRGEPVELAPVLRNLPLKPPRRMTS